MKISKIILYDEPTVSEIKINNLVEFLKNILPVEIEIRENISLGEYIIMPNHMHGIISIDYQIKGSNNNLGEFKSPSNTIGAIIRGYKGATTKRINNIRREEGEKKNSTGESQFALTD